MTIAIRDYEPYRFPDARSGSARLLAALQKHHDFNLSPPKGWKPRPPLKPPSQKNWFAIITSEPKIGDIRRAVCRHFGMTQDDLDTRRNFKRVVYPRQIGMFVAGEMTSRSVYELGRRFGGRDHSTILHGQRRIAALVKSDWKIAYDVAHVEALLS